MNTKEITRSTEQSQTLEKAVNAASAAAALFVATAFPMRPPVNSSQTQASVTIPEQPSTSSSCPSLISVDDNLIEILNQYVVTVTDQTNSSELVGEIVVTPPNRLKNNKAAWDLLAECIGTIEAPNDWAENHDKYLY